MRFLVFSFLALTILLTLFSYAFVDKNLSHLSFLYTGFSFNNRLITSIVFTLLISLLFVFYFLILKKIQKNKINLKQIKTIVLVVPIILFFSYPAMVSYD